MDPSMMVAPPGVWRTNCKYGEKSSAGLCFKRLRGSEHRISVLQLCVARHWKTGKVRLQAPEFLEINGSDSTPSGQHDGDSPTAYRYYNVMVHAYD